MSNTIEGTVTPAGSVNGSIQYTREELTMGLNTEKMASIINLLGGDASTLPDNLYSTYLNEICRLLSEGGVGGASTADQVTMADGRTVQAALDSLESNADMLALLNNYYVQLDGVVGIQVDYANKTFERLAAATGLNAGADFNRFPMFGGRRRCNVADDGTINAYFGDDGYTEDGSNGQVMVYQPAFYYRVLPITMTPQTDGVGYHLRKANYYVSATERPGFKLHPAFRDADGNPVDYILIGAYEGSLYDTSAAAYILDDAQVMDAAADKFCSIAGVKPASGLTQNLTRPNIEQMAKNRGTGWHGDFIQVASVNQLLMMIEMGTMNLQTAIGQGVVSISDNSAYNCSSLTGSTVSFGNGTGRAASTTNEKGGATTNETADGKTAVVYRGVENLWGNIWKFVYGVNIYGNGSQKGGVPFICTDLAFAESKKDGNYKSAGFSVTNANGYISAMGYGDPDFDWLFMASECLGNSTLPVGDYTYVTANLNGYRIAQLGSFWNYGTFAGGFCWTLSYGVGARYRAVGGRLVFIPTAKAA